jgi:hypothetical protein
MQDAEEKIISAKLSGFSPAALAVKLATTLTSYRGDVRLLVEGTSKAPMVSYE